MKTLLVMSMLLTAVTSHAEVIVEESGSKAIFMVNGRQVTPVEAQSQAASTNKIERCTPIKDAKTSDGQPAYRCKQVNLVINPKTGTTKWKNI